MDHDHSGMKNQCSMNMLFTWDTQNLCLIFRSWRVTSTLSLLVSLLAVVLLTAGYEAVRAGARRYEKGLAGRLDGLPRTTRSTEERSAKATRALLYAVQVFYSFFIMLLFMTYNGWVMFAVGVGAFVGYLLFAPADASAQKDVTCH